MKLIYISGKYTDKNYTEISKNILKARELAVKVWDKGHVALCPHLNTYHFEIDCEASYEQYIEGDLLLVKKCDGMLMLDNWKESKGAKIEKNYAEILGIPVYYKVEDIQ